MIYLDHAASTPLLPQVYELLCRSLQADFANSSSPHALGKAIHKKIENSRKIFLDLLNTDREGEFVFTSSGTESNNMIINSLASNDADTVICSEAGHPSVTVTSASQFQKVIPLYLDKAGVVDIDRLVGSIDETVKLVILLHVNGQSGVIQPIKLICDTIKKKYPHLWVHVDASQSFSKIKIDVSEIQCDSLTLASHKVGGPKGIAGLYVRYPKKITPILEGGGHELGLRSSTPASSLIEGFALAAKLQCAALVENNSHVESLRQRLVDKLSQALPDIRFPFLERSSPYILMAVLPGISSDILMRHLETQSIFISSTSACSSRVKGDNPVFKALGLAPELHKYVLRISFSAATTEEDMLRFSESLVSIYERLLTL